MKNILFYLIILSAFTFTNCKKADNNPSHNQLVIVDRKGHTVVSGPLSDTDISGSFDPSFGASAKTPSGDYSFSMGTFKGYAPSSVTFSSPQNLNVIDMWVSNMSTGTWAATSGTAYIESKSGAALFMNGGTKFMKITFNNVQFTKPTYINPNEPADTIWVSGIINAKR